MPQLGEWVYGSWDVEHHTARSVKLTRKGSSLPYRATKTISVEDRSMEVRYRVENEGNAPIQYLWSAHPLFAAGPGFRLQLPAEKLEFVTYPPDGESYRWPMYKGIDLSQEWVARGKTLKIFVSGLSAGRCELSTDEKEISVEFDVRKTPVLGIWFNHFGFPQGQSPFRCIAVEPCTSNSDVLDSSVDSSDLVLQSGLGSEWLIRLTLRR
jgi:galactose mutarotase-like enzyme